VVTIIDEPASPPANPPRSRVRPAAIVGTAAVVAVLVWWAWPTWSGRDGDLDVLVAGDEMLTDAQRSIDLRVREEGLTVAWSTVSNASSDWCDDPGALAAEVDRLDPRHVVVSFAGGADDATCVGDVLDALDGRHAVLVTQPGDDLDLLGTGESGSVDVLDPTRLIGGPDATVEPCQWWEECPPGGVQVRAVDGRLTDIGGERLARMIAASLRG
jgi:hypothetical protein